MPDIAIVNSTLTGEPKDYTLTGTQELLVKAVRATIDGSAAGSSFVPTLQMLAPDGTVMWEAATATSVAAGGSADVSWFPIGATTASATPSSSAQPWAFILFKTNITVLNGATGFIDMDTTSLYTNASSVFTTRSAVLGGGTVHGPGVLTDGHYLCKTFVEIGGFQTATSGTIATIFGDNPGLAESTYDDAGNVYNATAAVSVGQLVQYLESLVTVSGGSTSPWIIQVHNTCGVSIGAQCSMIVQQLDTNSTPI